MSALVETATCVAVGPQPTANPLALPRCRALTRDLRMPRPWIYWADWLASLALLLTAGELLHALALGRWTLPFAWQYGLACAAYAVACLAAYRAASFLHETAHQRRRDVPYFHTAWNLCCGVPFLLPSYFYAPHLDHHRHDRYGTEQDGEYFAGAGPRGWQAAMFLALLPIVPLAAVVRFLILTPLAWLIPPLRRWVDARASALVITFDYQRPPLPAREVGAARLQEGLCFAWCVALAVVGYFRPESLGPRLVEGYFIAVGVLLLNGVRTLGAHRWRGDGEAMTAGDQLADSVNYSANGWWNELLMPVGLRYHALHHLLPALPYHALPEAHRRLTAALPEDHPYRRAEAGNLSEVLCQL